MRFTTLATGMVTAILWGFLIPNLAVAQQFENPPAQYRVHTWWHWNGGIVTREGITKDLESMKKQGVSQATILNIGAEYDEDFGVEKVVFDSPEWYDRFAWSLQEAQRLGLKIGVHNCDGWSTTAGPWITPDKAMKKFVFTKTQLREDQPTISLPKPHTETDFYRDVAVVAIKKGDRLPPSVPLGLPEHMVVNDSIDAMVLADGDPESKVEVKAGYVIDLDNPTRALKSRIDIFQNYVGVFFYMSPPTVEYTVKTSDDGVHFKEIAHLTTKSFFAPEIFNIPATNARYFRIEVDKTHNLRPWHHTGLSELQLLGEEEKPLYHPSISEPLKKSSSVRVYKESTLTEMGKDASAAEVVAEEEVIDITDKMQPDGTLHWVAPTGNWTVIRFGYTSAKAYNISASEEGWGLEVDKMDTAALNFHFSQFPQKLLDKAGDLGGNTFTFLLVDSWEAGYQTWTHAMPDKFKNLRGYDIMRWIPVLCGETVESAEVSNAFLYDFRRTIADLLKQNFYDHYRTLCHRQGLEFHAEAIYGNNYPAPPIDVLTVNGLLDMPMTEFWAPVDSQSMVQYEPKKRGRPDFAVFAPNFYDIKSVGAEAYTGYAHYSESPADLKLLGDRAFCAGVSQMVLHSYAHQPNENKPGFTLGSHASHCNRHNPVWQYSRGWVDYQSRIQYALQNSRISADVLYYLGDQFPQFIENKTVARLPEGYQSVPCNFDVLTQLTVSGGKIRFSEEQQYSLLVLPDRPYVNYATLKQVERLVQAGAVIYGEKPTKMLSLFDIKQHRDDFAILADSLWSGYQENAIGRNHYGQGTVVWGDSIGDLVNELEINPDFTTQRADAENLLFIHRATREADVYFVVNQLDSTLRRECLFKTDFNAPEVWNPMNGQKKKLGLYAEEDGSIRIPVTLKSRESRLFVFRDEPMRKHLTRVQRGGTPLFPSTDGLLSEYVPEVISDADGLLKIVSDEKGQYTFSTEAGQRHTVDLAATAVREIDDFEGTLTLYPALASGVDSGDTTTLNITTLKSLTDFDQPEVRYFSGVAAYTIDFEVPASFADHSSSLYLSLGQLEATAEVRLNGKLLGYTWMPDVKLPVGELLREKNRLEVRVGTTYRNRFVGDFREYEEVKNLWSTASVASYLSKESSLKPTGLIGPLRLIKYASDDELDIN